MIFLVTVAYCVVVIFLLVEYIIDYVDGYFERNSFSTAELVILFIFGCIFWPIGVMYCIYCDINDIRIAKKMRKKEKIYIKRQHNRNMVQTILKEIGINNKH